MLIYHFREASVMPKEATLQVHMDAELKEQVEELYHLVLLRNMRILL